MAYVTSAGVKIYWEEHGAGDPLLLIMGLGATLIARAIPSAHLVMIPHASHMFFTDRFEASHAAILSFLDHASAETAAIKAAM